MSKKTPETCVKEEIKDYLTLEGWFHFPVLQGMGSYPGLPDRIAVKDGIVLFIEIKSPKGQMSKKQVEFGAAIDFHGGYYLLARGYQDILIWMEKWKRESKKS